MPSPQLPAALKTLLAGIPEGALAFSGGADSAYLLWAALAGGVRLDAYYVDTPFQPAFERRDAERLAGKLGARLTILPLDILADPAVAANPAHRCYHCKKNILQRISTAARADGHAVLMDGSNASDEAGERPGMRALAEFAVRSPLREAGLTKAEVRAAAREAGLFTWNKPAYACLATRVPTGTPLDAGTLARVEGAEDALFALGLTDFRCRVRGNAALLQLPAALHEEARARWGEITAALAPFFAAVRLDETTRPSEIF